MASIWLWNSMARRHRSISDTFEENGLAILKGSLEKNGHDVRIIDWAIPAEYNALSPVFLRKFNRLLIGKLLDSAGKKSLSIRFLGPVMLIAQTWLNFMQGRRMKRKLTMLAKEVRDSKIPVFGIKLWYGEAFTWAKFLTTEIKKYSTQTLIVAGGYHATLYEEDVLRYSNFDLAIAGAGEAGLKGLMDCLAGEEKGESLIRIRQAIIQGLIPGAIYREGGNIRKAVRADLCAEIEKEKVIPKYERNNGKAKVHVLMESMGCPWNQCYFCVHNQFEPVYRSRAVADIIREIKEMIRQGIGLFRFAGSDTPYTFGLEIAKAILEEGIKIEFTMGSRAVKGVSEPRVFNEMTDALTVMIRAGLRGVFMGGESGNDQINREVMNKGLNSEDLLYSIKAIRQAEISAEEKCSVSLAFIYPPPLVKGVTLAQVMEDNVRLIQRAMPDSVMITPPGPFKNSFWYHNREQFGFELGENMIEKAMEYEYVLYKPLTMWPKLDLKLQGKDFMELLKESQKLRGYIENVLGIPTDLSDEHFLMLHSAGIKGKEAIQEFKRKNLISIISCDYSYADQIAEKVSARSSELSALNTAITA